MQGSFENTKAIKCPRCGYDQRGVVATWVENCPLGGVCAECGLDIKWSELLSLKRQLPGWCVEYATGICNLGWRIVKTLFMAHVPWAMWKLLRMSDPPRWRILVASGVLALAIVAVGSYFIMGLNLAGAMHDGYSAGSTTTMNSSTTSVRLSEAALRVVFMPLSKHSPGTVTHTANRWTVNSQTWTEPYPPPSDMWYYQGYLSGKTGAVVFDALVTALLLLCLCAMAFVVLPESRRRAKVRWEHVWRIMAYSFSLLLIPIVLILACQCFLQWHALRDLAAICGVVVRLYCLLILPIAALLFWQAAASRYLRMNQTWPVAISLTLMAWLASGAIVFYVRNPLSPSEFWEMCARAFA